MGDAADDLDQEWARGGQNIDHGHKPFAHVEVSLEGLEALQRDRNRLREVLRPFISGCFDDNGDQTIARADYTLGAVKAAWWAMRASDRLERSTHLGSDGDG